MFFLELAECVGATGTPRRSAMNHCRIFNTTNEAMCILDAATGGILDANRAMLEMFGLGRHEILARTVEDLNDGKAETCAGAVRHRMRQAVEEGPQQFEWRARRRDGTLLQVEIRLQFTQIGGKGRVQAVIRDITEQKRLEEVVRIQRDLAVTLNSVTDVTAALKLCLEAAIRISGMDAGGVYLVDKPSGDLSLAAHQGPAPGFTAWVRHYSADAPEAKIMTAGRPLFSHVDSLDISEAERTAFSRPKSIAILPISHHGEVVACLNLASQTDNEIPQVARNALESIAGQVAGAIARLTAERELIEKQRLVAMLLDHCRGAVFVKDLEGRYLLANEGLRQLQNELAHVDRLNILGELTSGLAHELRQPLACLNVYAQTCSRLIDAGTDDHESLREAIGEIAKEVKRAAAIVKRMRSFGRKRTDLRINVDINGLVREVAELTAPEAKRRGVSIQLSLGEGLPPVFADSIQIQQVISNLILNGIQAIDGAGAETGEITIATRITPMGDIHVAVRDSGPGVPEEILDRIFEPFFTTRPDGMGLGLSISRNIIEDHQGRIFATSNDGRSREFNFILPSVITEQQKYG